MNNILKYILVGGLVFALVFVVALPFFGASNSWAFGCGWGRGGATWGMGPGMMGRGWGFPGMMGGFGLFGGLMMFGMLLYPILIIGLIVAGIFWLVKTVTKHNQQQ